MAVRTKIIDRGAERFKGQLDIIAGSHVDIGIFGGIKRSEGDPVSIAEYALYNEMGSSDGKHPPERSFIRSTIDQKGKFYQRFLDDGLESIAFGERTSEQVLKELGIIIQEDIKRKIVDLKTPPLAESTKRAKARTIKGKVREGVDKGKSKKAVFVAGAGNPLIDTGTMLRAIDHKVTL